MEGYDKWYKGGRVGGWLDNMWVCGWGDWEFFLLEFWEYKIDLFLRVEELDEAEGQCWHVDIVDYCLVEIKLEC